MLSSGEQPLCPVSGQPIASTADNVVVASILSRYLFKQQITKAEHAKHVLGAE